MLKRLPEFFEERNGRLSSQRLIFIVGSFFCMWLVGWMIVKSKGENWDGAMAIFLSLYGSIAAGKLVQKNQEKNDESKKLPE
jgi:hypothetical protein